jgi:hypothetical protein
MHNTYRGSNYTVTNLVQLLTFDAADYSWEDIARIAGTAAVTSPGTYLNLRDFVLLNADNSFYLDYLNWWMELAGRFVSGILSPSGPVSLRPLSALSANRGVSSASFVTTGVSEASFSY